MRNGIVDPWSMTEQADREVRSAMGGPSSELGHLAAFGSRFDTQNGLKLNLFRTAARHPLSREPCRLAALLPKPSPSTNLHR